MDERNSNPEGRTDKFARNAQLENLLTDLNSDLWVAEKALLQQTGTELPYPLILVMGPHRSGSTLFMQWLARTGLVAYPSNLLSRFYRAPILGAKIQLLATDPRFNYRNELGEFLQQPEYHSENGKTQGALAPNEFWYFWRRFLPEFARDVWTDEELRNGLDAACMIKELNGLMQILGKPFAAKGMLFNYNIRFLDQLFDKVVFVHLVRDEARNAESVLDARRRQLGSEEAWYSFQIPETERLKNLDPPDQVVGQIRAINRAVRSGLEQVREERTLTIRYEDFCADPAAVYGQLAGRLAQQGAEAIPDYVGPQHFTETRKVSDNRVQDAIRKVATTSG